MTDKKTVGQHARETAMSGERVSAKDIQREAHKEHLNNIIKLVKQDMHKYDGDFFVVVSPRSERILTNVVRNQIWTRSSCPTPTYDQHVYHYDSKKEELIFVWAVPDRQTALLFKKHALELKPEQKPLRDNVLQFFDGSLYRLMKKFNGEHDAPGCGLKEKNKPAQGIDPIIDKE